MIRPDQCSGGLTNVAAVAAGAYHSLGLKSDGTVVAWETTVRARPENVPSGLTQRGSRGGRLCPQPGQLQGDGTVVAWGSSSDGQDQCPIRADHAVAIALGATKESGLEATGVRL